MFQYEIDDDVILFEFNKPVNQAVGWYEDGNDIFISKLLPKIAREVIYLHERQHRKCKKEGCFCCSQSSDFWCEYHAMKAEFEDCLKAGPAVFAEYRRQFVAALKKYKSDKKWESHLMATRKLMGLKKFREVML